MLPAQDSAISSKTTHFTGGQVGPFHTPYP